MTALMLAAEKGHINVVTELLKGGANPDIKSDLDRTALDYARFGKHERVVELLQPTTPRKP
jgi:ankyrin repeat protein